MNLVQEGEGLLPREEPFFLDMPPHFRRTQKNNLNLAHWGGRGKPLLLIHGLAGSVHWWDFSAPQISSHFETAALDFEGHGDSAWAESGTYTMETFIANIEEARIFLGWEKFFLVGHSLGARVSVEYAARYPQRLNALAAVDFMPEPKKSTPLFSKLSSIRQPVFLNLETGINRFHLQPRQTALDATHLKNLAKFLIKPTGAGYTWKCDWRTFSVRYETAWKVLSKIKTPSLIVRGELSSIMNQDDLRKISQEIAQSKNLEIPKAYHHVPLDAPEALSQALIDFARELSLIE